MDLSRRGRFRRFGGCRLCLSFCFCRSSSIGSSRGSGGTGWSMYYTKAETVSERWSGMPRVERRKSGKLPFMLGLEPVFPDVFQVPNEPFTGRF
uniref:Putative secreted peptide n=1 Tax=Anopheles braziliensis TaxID=58242 RepID=A0A2M3ZST6_9DIPT